VFLTDFWLLVVAVKIECNFPNSGPLLPGRDFISRALVAWEKFLVQHAPTMGGLSFEPVEG
jgi:hypothetical protein